MEVIGRVEPGAETENESGDRVDGVPELPAPGKEPVGKLMRRIYAITPSDRTFFGEAKEKVQEYFGGLIEAQQ